jgi:hypothetical protein
MIGHRFIYMLAAVASLLLTGCNRNNSLHGNVTYNGEPVEKGSISFRPLDGNGPGFGAQIVDGKYLADKARLGKHVALVRGVRTTVAPQTTEQAIQQFKEAKAAGKTTLDHFGQAADYIPENGEGNSQTVDVEGGKQSLDFALKGPPRS